MTYRSRGRSSNEAMAATIFAGFLVGFIFYLCLGNYQRAKRAMERQRKRRLELEEEKRALVRNRGGGDASVGNSSHRRRNNNFAIGINNTNNNGAFDSPRSHYSGSSSMYTDEKGLTVGVGGVEVVGDGSHNHMLLGGDGDGGRGFSVAQHRTQAQPPDLLDDNGGAGGHTSYTSLRKNSHGEMSV